MLLTKLEARLDNKPQAARWWCRRSSGGWFTLWLGLEFLLPFQFSCFADNVRRVPDPATGRSAQPPGVSTRLAGTLSSSGKDMGNDDSDWSMAGPLVAALKARGWTDGELLTHYYDWRLSPAEWDSAGSSGNDSSSGTAANDPDTYAQLQAQVERAVAVTGLPATLVGFSMGATYATRFLSDYVTPEWKRDHVRGLVAISGLWAGTPVPLRNLISGSLDNVIDLLSPWLEVPGRLLYGRRDTATAIRGLPSVAWMCPEPQPAPSSGGGRGGVGGSDGGSGNDGGNGGEGKGGGRMPEGGGEDEGQEVLVVNEATGRSYGAGDVGQLLRDVGAAEAASFWAASRHKMTAAAPGVRVHCFYSHGLPTPQRLTYRAADFSDVPDAAYTDGDLTVPHDSLALCRSWAAQQDAPVRAFSYHGVQHAQLLNDADALEDIVEATAA